jgi:hypothetical protein
MRVLSFDPGETTGWCYQDKENTLDFGQAKGLTELIQVCDKFKGVVDHVVIEDYKILGQKAMSHSGSRVPTIQMIGYLKAWAITEGLKEPTLYPARLKPIQQKQTGMKPIGAHKDNHWVDAYNHGRWYLIQEHGAQTALEKKMGVKK